MHKPFELNMMPRHLGKSGLTADSFLSRFLPLLTAIPDALEKEFVNAVTYGHSHPHIFNTPEKVEMSVEHVLNRIREFPLHEIEIVKNEIIAGTNTRVVALYHIGFCPSEEDVWMYTMNVGTGDDVQVCGLIRDIENSIAQVAEGLAAEAVADDELLAELLSDDVIRGNEEAMRPEDPGASGAAD